MPPRTGSMNKNKERLFNALRKEYGDDFDPVMRMAQNAHLLQEIADDLCTNDKVLIDGSTGESINKSQALVTAQSAWEKIAVYVQPKLKQVEINHTGGIDVKQYRGVSEVSERVAELIGSRADGDTESRTTH